MPPRRAKGGAAAQRKAKATTAAAAATGGSLRRAGKKAAAAASGSDDDAADSDADVDIRHVPVLGGLPNGAPAAMELDADSGSDSSSDSDDDAADLASGSLAQASDAEVRRVCSLNKLKQHMAPLPAPSVLWRALGSLCLPHTQPFARRDAHTFAG